MYVTEAPTTPIIAISNIVHSNIVIFYPHVNCLMVIRSDVLGPLCTSACLCNFYLPVGHPIQPIHQSVNFYPFV